jgi:O-antigen ligase
LLVWPAALLCWRRFGRWSAALPLLVLAAVIAVGPQRSAFVAWPLALLAALAVLAAGRRAVKVIAVLLAVTLLAAPLLVASLPRAETVRSDYPGVPASFVHRLAVWRFANDRLSERPIHGWGMRASRAIPGGEVLIDVGGRRPGKTMPLHPHNGLLQIWLELGAIGALLAAAFLFAAVSALRRLEADRAGHAALIATITTGFAYSSLSYGIWQTWWLAAMALSVIFTLTLARKRPDP